MSKCAHQETFWGDDPYLICRLCGQIRDAATGRVVRPAQEDEPRAPDVTPDVTRDRWTLVKDVADPAAPTVAELEAGEDLTPYLTDEPLVYQYDPTPLAPLACPTCGKTLETAVVTADDEGQAVVRLLPCGHCFPVKWGDDGSPPVEG